MLSFYKDKAGAAKAAAENIQRTTKIAIDEASSYSTIPPEKVVRPPLQPGHQQNSETPLILYLPNALSEPHLHMTRQLDSTVICHTPGGGRESPLVMPAQLEHMDSAFGGLRPVAMDVFHLLGYVSLNMAGFRKMLKKYAKNVEPSKPQPGEYASTPVMSDEPRAMQ